MSDRFDQTLEHMLDTKADANVDAGVTAVRRIELITGAGRRRQWSEDDKARIVIESLRPGTNVSEVARRNGLSPQQLFGWRREARELMAEPAGACDPRSAAQDRPSAPRAKNCCSKPSASAEPAFASVVIAAPAPPSPPGPPASGRIEIAIGDAVVRVLGQIEPATLTAVLRAVRRAS